MENINIIKLLRLPCQYHGQSFHLFKSFYMPIINSIAFLLWSGVVSMYKLLPIVLFLFLFFKIYLFIYFWLCWVFVSVRGLSLVVASGGHSSLRCAGFSLSRPLLLRSTGSRHAGSAIVAHGPSCSAACGILPDQDSNPCPLHWQADSQPLRHQGSPIVLFDPLVFWVERCYIYSQFLLILCSCPCLFLFQAREKYSLIWGEFLSSSTL